MLYPIVIMLERASGIVGRINEDAFDSAGKFLFEGFKGEEVVAVDEHVAAMRVAIGFLRIFDEDARFQNGMHVLADLGQFQFLLVGH